MKDRPYTLKDIETGLRNADYFYSRAESGDLDAIIQLADSQLALEKADPTEAQLQAVELVWKREYTLKEAGDRLGISPQAVRFNLQLLSIKLTEVVNKWAGEVKKND